MFIFINKSLFFLANIESSRMFVLLKTSSYTLRVWISYIIQLLTSGSLGQSGPGQSQLDGIISQ